MAGDEEGNDDGGKSDGNDDKVGGQATASNGKGGRRLMATRARVTAKMWVMAMVTRLAGDKEGKGKGGKGDGDGDDGGG